MYLEGSWRNGVTWELGFGQIWVAGTGNHKDVNKRTIEREMGTASSRWELEMGFGKCWELTSRCQHNIVYLIAECLNRRVHKTAGILTCTEDLNVRKAFGTSKRITNFADNC